MRIIVAPQALKGSLTATEAGQAIALGIHAVDPEADVQIIPMADGGEGTAQALVDATGGEMLAATVTGPLGQPVQAFYATLGDGKTAVIEMAACAGLPLLKPEQRDPRITTTYGVGELIRAALDRGYRSFIIGIGGSATNDGGAGMAQALGATLYTAKEKPVARGGAALSTLESISIEHMDPRLQECTFDVACDVTSPLCGPQGASALFGPQKGATSEMVHQLDQALAHYAAIIEQNLGIAVKDLPGSGAAGGLGAGLIAFLHAKILSGAQIVLTTSNFAARAKDADLVITAEGQIDSQTACGKSIGIVAQFAKRHHLPVLALTGNLGTGYECVYALGVDAVMPIASGPMTFAYSMERAALLLRQATERSLRLLQLGSLHTSAPSHTRYQSPG
jgi:glycerate kinase